MSSPLVASVKPDESAVSSHYRKIVLRRFALAGAILAFILLSLILDFIIGPSGLSLAALWHALVDAGSADAGTRVIVWELRLPIALMAIVVGMALGLAGAEMQTILNNPLASPFTLGVSSAASFGAALAIILGLGIPGIPDQWFISVNAFVLPCWPALFLMASAAGHAWRHPAWCCLALRWCSPSMR
jgi:iron complex transport system permease protein